MSETSNNLVQILNMDCTKLMSETEDNAFDLAIVDPPYGINAQSMGMGNNPNRKDGWIRGESTAVVSRKARLNHGRGTLKNRALNTMNCEWDNRPPSQAYFDELFRVSRNQIIWGGNYFDLPPTRGVICWDKVQPWENFSQWEMAWTSFSTPAAMFRHSNTGGANAEIKIHPTQKPRRLYAWLLEKFADIDMRILDTHSGSGSLAIEAHYFGCELVACEIDELYYRSSVERFEHETKQHAIALNDL